MRIRASTMPHYDYARYIIDHGTADEKHRCRETLQTMQTFLDVFEGGNWEPMTNIVLIDHLVVVADQIAAKRFETAKNQKYGDYQGKRGRTIEEEQQTVRGHVAAQMMLGLPLGKPDTKEEARRQGNIGNGNEAFIPLNNPVSHNLIVDPKTQDHIVSWLVVPEGERSYRLDGWIKAEDAKQDVYRKERHRDGGTSIAYWVPPKNLSPVRDWWAMTTGDTWPTERHEAYIEISSSGVTEHP